MASGSLKALLAVLAVAGYQNRDKIAEILRGVTEGPETPAGSGSPSGKVDATSSQAGGLDDVLEKLRSGGLGSLLSGGSFGSVLSGGLNDLLDQFRKAGHEAKAESWVKPGANEPVEDHELASALGPDALRDIAAKTGLSEEEVLQRLSKNLPDAVDALTPDGQVPSA